ncbi:MAG: M48 family metalloprotease [Deltaproteobacteria bacterium]|nr:M48 family metalloprotease [Deltaproteobacteria bacterium]
MTRERVKPLPKLRGSVAYGLVAMCAFAACIQNDGTRWSPLQPFELMSLDDERQLGMDFDREIEGHFRLITDPVVTGFLYDLGQQIVARVEPQPFVYRFQIVEAPQLNAFAVPGGYIYFHSGTLLAAGSVDELAGVMAHEVAHVNKRHLAHRRQERQLPSMLTQAALIAASVVSQNAAPLITGMAINVAVDLHYSRSDEAEADRLGAVYASRAGFDSSRSADFFRRILEKQADYPDTVPPYLFSHPQVAERIRVVEEQAKTLAPVGKPTPGTHERFRAMQARLAQLLDLKRVELPGSGVATDHSANDPELERIDALIRDDDPNAALSALTNLSVEDPRDPRVPFRIGDLLYETGRLDGAIAAYRRTIELDSARALVFYNLGIAYRDSGDRHRAVYALEQALKRGTRSGPLATRARWEVVKLTFGVIAEAGFGDGASESSGGTPAGKAVEQYPLETQQMVWWGRVSGPVLHEKDQIRIRWRDPAGKIVSEKVAEEAGRVHLISRLEMPRVAPGEWVVEVLLDDGVVHRSAIRVGA